MVLDLYQLRPFIALYKFCITDDLRTENYRSVGKYTANLYPMP